MISTTHIPSFELFGIDFGFAVFQENEVPPAQDGARQLYVGLKTPLTIAIYHNPYLT